MATTIENPILNGPYEAPRRHFRFDEEGMQDDKALVQTVAHDIRARIQENLWDMLAKRKSVWFG